MTDLLTRTEPVAPDLSPPHRRWRRWLLVVVVLLLVVAVIVIPLRDWYVSGYQPISVGNGSFLLDIQGPREKGVVRRPTFAIGEPSEIAEIPFQLGGSMRMVFPIFNDGDRTIRVTHVAIGPEPTERVTVLDPVAIEKGEQIGSQNPTAPGNTQPFVPFLLRPGDNPLLEFRYDFVCQRPGGGTEIRDRFRVRFELLGGSRWVELPLMWRLVLDSPTKAECPPGSAVFGSS